MDDAYVARADEETNRIESVREHHEQCACIQPGACDEYFGGEGVPRPPGLPAIVAAESTPTLSLPPGPRMWLCWHTGGDWYTYRIGNKLMDVNAKWGIVQPLFYDGKRGRYIDASDGEWDEGVE